MNKLSAIVAASGFALTSCASHQPKIEFTGPIASPSSITTEPVSNKVASLICGPAVNNLPGTSWIQATFNTGMTVWSLSWDCTLQSLDGFLQRLNTNIGELIEEKK